jgi:hypothetical protein
MKIVIESPIKCPCCSQPVTAPTPDMVADLCMLRPLQKRILEAVWRGKGMPVMTERIFDAMYYDHPDGGGSQSRMYNAFKVALCGMRKLLAEHNTGVWIETVGYRQGYRLKIETEGTRK